MTDDARRAFESFTSQARPRLRRALIVRYGVDVGAEATADAMAYAWQHWTRIERMNNPVGYLYRVGQSSARRHRRWARPTPTTGTDISSIDAGARLIDLELDGALRTLRHDERVAVVMVHGYGWSYQEVADLLGAPVSSVRNHVHRGLGRLRSRLEMS